MGMAVVHDDFAACFALPQTRSHALSLPLIPSHLLLSPHIPPYALL